MNFLSTLNDDELDQVAAIVRAPEVVAEQSRRAEIRIERNEFGGSHAASWYESRPAHVLRNGSTMFHAMDCPGCANTPFTLSPRSETYWCS